ncbi:YhgE/Pip family protein [Haloimpatiens sp. FM7315]|uniref:YhgE/Pip domain-containing protein n=1 Tax=Haloimpatiens sp. FM7315 TaxID=3298609 RepID=UPI00370CADA7
MQNILRIFTSDIKSILKNRIALIIVGGLLVLPSLYAWFNIYASWNPYKNTNGIKIAICNKDLGAKIKDKDVNIGKEVQKNLSKNKALGWTFVKSQDEAIELADKGKVYATIIIPKDFSAKISTILSDNSMKPTLEYYVNEKINAISPKITDKGASTIQANISSSFIESVTEQIISTMRNVGVELTDVKPLFNVQKKDLDSLIKNLPSVITRLNSTANSIKSDTKTVKLSSKELESIKDVSNKLSSFTKNFKKDIDTVNSNTSDVSSKVKEKLNSLKVSIEDLDQDILTLKEKASLEKPNYKNDIENDVASLNTIVKEMKNIQKGLSDSENKISPKVNELYSATDKQLNDLQSLLLYLNAASTKLEDVNDTVNSIHDLNSKITDNLLSLKSLLQMLGGDNNIINNAINQIDKTINVINSVDAKTTSIDRQTKEYITFMRYYTSSSYEKIKGIRKNSSEIYALLKSESSYLKPSIGEVIDLSLNKLNDVSSSLDKLSSKMDDIAALEKSINEIHDLNNDMISRIDGISIKLNTDLTSSVKRYLLGISSFANDIDGLLNKVNEEGKQLSDFINKASNKGDVAAEDMIKLSKSLSKLQNNLILIDGKLARVLDKLNFNKLIDKVENNKSDIAKFMASPVDLETHALYSVENYGTSMTPFYTTLALWVGILILASLLTTETKNIDFEVTHIEAYLGKFLLFASLAMVQALIVSLGDIYLLKVTACEPILFIKLNMFLSLVFCSIVYTLVYLFGNVGKAISVILLVLQVAGSGGTFPIQMTPPFFRRLYVWLPFTYGISSLREAVAGVLYSELKKDVYILLCYIVVSLATGILLVNTTHKFMDKMAKKLKESGVTE